MTNSNKWLVNMQVCLKHRPPGLATFSANSARWSGSTAALKPVLAVLLVVSFTTGCAALQEPQQGAQTDARNVAAAKVLPEGGIRYDTTSARVAELWNSAEEAQGAQNPDLALRHLFEALEISPQNSALWSKAAEIQLSNQQAALAENFAVKSNTFAGTNASLLHRNWLIIEHARSLRGDLLGVRSAHKKVTEYQYR